MSIDKVFDKIEHPFVIKTLKLGIEVNFLNLIKGIYKKCTANIMSGDRLYAFSRDVHSYHFYSILYWKFNPGQLGKKEK